MSCLDCIHTPLDELIPYLAIESGSDTTSGMGGSKHHGSKCGKHHGDDCCPSVININNHNEANAACGGSTAGDNDNGNGGEDPPINGACIALQASSSTGQVIEEEDEAVLVEIDVTDLSKGGLLLVDSEAVVPEDGCYFALAAPQVGSEIPAPNETFRLWLAVNGNDVPNSNVLMKLGPHNKDVIVSQGVLDLVAGDKVSCKMAASSGNKGIGLEVFDNDDEPLIPGIIFTMYKL